MIAVRLREIREALIVPKIDGKEVSGLKSLNEKKVSCQHRAT